MISHFYPSIQFIDINANRRPCRLHLQNAHVTMPRFLKHPPTTFARTTMLSGLFREQLRLQVMYNPDMDYRARSNAHNITAITLAEGHLNHVTLQAEIGFVEGLTKRPLYPRKWKLVIAS